MKRIIAFMSVLLIMFSFVSCSNQPEPGEVEPSPVEKAQGQIIAGLGVTRNDSRIVGYQGTNDYVKYVVVYYENGIKTDEVTHMFYITDAAFEEAEQEMSGKSHVTQVDAEKRYISYWSGVALYGTYAEDLEIIKADYTIK